MFPLSPPAETSSGCNRFLRTEFCPHSGWRISRSKIALAKLLHDQNFIQNSVSPESLVREYIKSYHLQSEYITGHNLEVLLSMEEDNGPQEHQGNSFLYPLPDLGKTVQFSYASLSAKRKLFFNGSPPPRRLRLSSYLYYRGVISYYQMMESVAWQKNRRPLIGQMAMQIGKLTADGFARIIVHVKNGECFGEVARKYHLLTGNVISALVKAQEKYDCRIGRFFIEKEILPDRDIQTLELEMRQHNLKFR